MSHVSSIPLTIVYDPKLTYSTPHTPHIPRTTPISIPDAVNIPCSCQNPHTVLNVTCVYMDHLKEIKVQHCLKCPTTVQLLELGLFPCAPVWPGLAVSLVMLEWACMLFLHMALNVQAWADTVEIMLKHQGYSFRKSH